jgi:hypothetical protein
MNSNNDKAFSDVGSKIFTDLLRAVLSVFA